MAYNGEIIVSDSSWDFWGTLERFVNDFNAKACWPEAGVVRPLHFVPGKDVLTNHLDGEGVALCRHGFWDRCLFDDGRESDYGVLFGIRPGDGVCAGGHVLKVVDNISMLDGLLGHDANYGVPPSAYGVGSRFAGLPGGIAPVVDADLLYDRICSVACSRDNILSFGMEARECKSMADLHAWLPFGECGYYVAEGYVVHPFNMAELDNEFCSRDSVALGRYSLNDAREVANNLLLDGCDYAGSWFSRLCDRIEDRVKDREAVYSSPGFRNAFLPGNDPTLHEALLHTEDMLRRVVRTFGWADARVAEFIRPENSLPASVYLRDGKWLGLSRSEPQHRCGLVEYLHGNPEAIRVVGEAMDISLRRMKAKMMLERLSVPLKAIGGGLKRK